MSYSPAWAQGQDSLSTLSPWIHVPHQVHSNWSVVFSLTCPDTPFPISSLQEYRLWSFFWPGKQMKTCTLRTDQIKSSKRQERILQIKFSFSNQKWENAPTLSSPWIKMWKRKKKMLPGCPCHLNMRVPSSLRYSSVPHSIILSTEKNGSKNLNTLLKWVWNQTYVFESKAPNGVF